MVCITSPFPALQNILQSNNTSHPWDDHLPKYIRVGQNGWSDRKTLLWTWQSENDIDGLVIFRILHKSFYQK